MADGSDVSVAHGAAAHVDVGTTLDFYVRVRDMCGRPLKGATVTIGSPFAPKATNDAGLATFSGLTGASTPSVNVEYTPLFGKTAGTAVHVGPQSVSTQGAFDPTPPGSPMTPSKLELHTTILVPVYYPLKRLFSWQNPILRQKIYMDGISVDEFVGAHPKDNHDLNRMLRLSETLKHYDADYQKLTDAQAEVNKSLKSNGDLQKKLAADQAQKTKDQDTYDKKSGSATPKVADALRAKVDKDQTGIDKDIELIDASSKRLTAANDALTAAKASHGGSTHRQMMEYLIDKVLPKTNLDDWIKYGIIHLTGLRYRPSSGCCWPPGPVVYGLREKEIDENEHPSSSASSADDFAKTQCIFAREYLALLSANPELLKSVAGLYTHQKTMMTTRTKGGGVGIKPRLARSGVASTDKSRKDLLAKLEKLARSDGPWLVPVPDPLAPKSKKPPPQPDDLYDLRAIASAVSEAWMKRIGASTSAGRPPDENELLGEIADRYFHAQIPEIVWTRAVRSTQLLHDFAEDGWDMTPKLWNQPTVPPEWARAFAGDPSVWLTHHQTTMQPYVTGVVCNDVASVLARARGLPIGDAEFIMGMAVVVEAAGKANVAKLTKAQAAKAEAAKKKLEADGPAGGAPVAPTAPTTNPAAPATPPAPAPPAPADAASDALPTVSSAEYVGIFRPTRLSDIRRGDILFVGHWTAADPSKEAYIVPPQFVSDLGRAYAVDDPDNYGEALNAGIPEITSLDELDIPLQKVAFGKQTGRNPGKDRIVRAWYRYTNRKAPKKGEPPLPPPTADDPRVAVYEALTYEHIATVIDVTKEHVVFLETAEPVGIILRP